MPDHEPPRHYLAVGESQHGMQLSDFLGAQWPELARSEIRNMAMNGWVEIHGDPATKPRRRLKEGDVVIVTEKIPVANLKRDTRQRRATEAKGFEVLYEDDDLLIVDKPAGVPITGKLDKDREALAPLLEERPDAELRALHRPDRAASGCLVLTKSIESLRRCEAALANGTAFLDAVALVHGDVRWKQKTVDRPLGPDPLRRGRISAVEPGTKGSRPAVTEVEVREAFRKLTLVRIRPKTSRNHQLRVHMGFVGHPLVADPDYGVRRQLKLSDIKKGYKGRPGVVERPLLQRMFLHVERVCVPDAQGAPVEVTAPLAADLTLVLKKLRSFAAKRH